MKASQRAWNHFVRTGNVADYLNYRTLLSYEQAGELTPAQEETDAPADRGDRDPGNNDRGK